MIKTLEIIFKKFKHKLSLLTPYVNFDALIDVLLLNGVNTNTIDFLFFLQDTKVEGFDLLSEHI